MKKILRRILITSLLVLPFGAYGQTAQRLETEYQSRSETSYRSIPKKDTGIKVPDTVSTETRFNPAGTHSRSKLGLISVRRDQPEFPAFLLGMQNAAMKATKEPLNVAPLSLESLADQAEELQKRGVETLLVDAPDPADALAFFKRAKFLERRAVLLCETFPKGVNPPLVLASPILQTERAAEEAIRFVGNVTVEVVYILGETPNDIKIADYESKAEQVFLKPFANVAPNITVTRIDPDEYSPTLVPPAVVVLATRADSELLASTIGKKFPDSKIVAIGEGPAVVEAFEDEAIDVRIRPDYTRILGFALQEAQQKSTMPLVVHPTMDKHWDPVPTKIEE